jgi:hypothetical protein
MITLIWIRPTGKSTRRPIPRSPRPLGPILLSPLSLGAVAVCHVLRLRLHTPVDFVNALADNVMALEHFSSARPVDPARLQATVRDLRQTTADQPQQILKLACRCIDGRADRHIGAGPSSHRRPRRHGMAGGDLVQPRRRGSPHHATFPTWSFPSVRSATCHPLAQWRTLSVASLTSTRSAPSWQPPSNGARFSSGNSLTSSAAAPSRAPRDSARHLKRPEARDVTGEARARGGYRGRSQRPGPYGGKRGVGQDVRAGRGGCCRSGTLRGPRAVGRTLHQLSEAKQVEDAALDLQAAA